MRLTFVSPPFAGHFNPLLVLAKTAQAAGHDVEFITGPRKQAVLTASGIGAPALRSIGPDTLESIANTGDPVGSNPLKLLAQFRQNLRLLPAIGVELEERWRKAPPGIVVADSVAPIAGLVAERLGITWITTIATPFSIETQTGTPSYCGGWTPGNKLRDATGRLGVRKFKQFVGLMFQSEFAALGLKSIYRKDGSEAIYSPLAILGFGLRELEFDRDWPAPFEMIGPVIAAPEAAPHIVPPARPMVMVTLGTHLLWAKQSLVDDVAALSRLMPHVHFVVSLGQPENAGEPARRCTANVSVHRFVSYAFDEYDAVIHHGGAGVTYAAILAGVPSLVVPKDYDQFDYAARVVHHGLGLRCDSIRDAQGPLERLLKRDHWPALHGLQASARNYSPERRFLEILNEIC